NPPTAPRKRRTRWSGLIVNRRLRTKLLVVILVEAAVAIGSGGLSLIGMASMQSRSDHMYRDNLSRVASLGKGERAALNMRTDVLNAAMSTSPEIRIVFTVNLKRDDAQLDDAIAEYSRNSLAGREKNVALLKAGIADYRTVRDDKLLPAADAADP